MNKTTQRILELHNLDEQVAKLAKDLPGGEWSIMEYETTETHWRIGDVHSGRIYPAYSSRLDVAFKLPPPPFKRLEISINGDGARVRFCPDQVFEDPDTLWTVCANKPAAIAETIARLWLAEMQAFLSPI